MYDDDFPWFLFMIPLFFFLFFLFIHSLSHASNNNDDYYIPSCDFNHRGHWEVSVNNANDRSEVEPIVNKYIALGWHDIRAEVHNEGVNDRILAEC